MVISIFTFPLLLAVVRANGLCHLPLDTLCSICGKGPKKGNCGTVAFYVQLSRPIGVGKNQVIKYGDVIHNQGDGYNKENGIFTAPCSGTYVFTWTTFLTKTHTLDIALVVNGKVYARGETDSASKRISSSSQTAVIALKRKEKAWIQSTDEYTGEMYGYGRTNFSGWRIGA